MTTTVILVRHGLVHNPDDVFYERLPGFVLSDTGKAQAKALGKYLRSHTIHAIYASPLERTQETASYIHAHHPHLTVIPDERLIEVSSIKRGQKQGDLALERWNFYKPEYTRQGGEKLGDIWKRMNAFFREKVREHQGQTIVAVSHGDPIMISVVKHKGKRLALSEIRGQWYVDTATGFEIRFQSDQPVQVNSISREIIDTNTG